MSLFVSVHVHVCYPCAVAIQCAVKQPSKGAPKDDEKKRATPINDDQREEMIQYMEKHTNFAQGRLEKTPNAALKMEEMKKKIGC